MNNTVKNTLIVILFLACISMAFLAGRITGKNEPYPVGNYQVRVSSSEQDSPLHADSKDTNLPVVSDKKRSEGSLNDEPDSDGKTARNVSVDHDDSVDRGAAENETLTTPGFRPDPYELRKMFPDNRALPPVDQEEFLAKQKEKERRNRQYGRIAANKATVDEINEYYAEQTALAEDSAVILTYILTEYADRMSEEDIKRHEFLLDSFEKRLERIPQKKAEALARIQSQQATK